MLNKEVWLISYDISSNKRLKKVAVKLSSIGERIQKSLYLCEISYKELKIAQKELSNLISVQEDSLIYIPLCPRDKNYTSHFSSSNYSEVENNWVV